MNRRSVFKTFGALLLGGVVGPVRRAFGYKGVRLVINGVAIEMPDKLDIVIEVDSVGADAAPITLTIVGGVLRVKNDKGPALVVKGRNGGGFHFEGSMYGVEIDGVGNSVPVVCMSGVVGSAGAYPQGAKC